MFAMVTTGLCWDGGLAGEKVEGSAKACVFVEIRDMAGTRTGPCHPRLDTPTYTTSKIENIFSVVSAGDQSRYMLVYFL